MTRRSPRPFDFALSTVKKPRRYYLSGFNEVDIAYLTGVAASRLNYPIRGVIFFAPIGRLLRNGDPKTPTVTLIGIGEITGTFLF